MNQLEKEIKNYRILACMMVRATGSVYAKHPHRCLWDICGKLSIQWVLESMIQCRYIDRIVVCTEDRQIKGAVEKLGIMVIDRPLHQAHDFPRDYTQGKFKRIKPRSLIHGKPSIFINPRDYTLYYMEETENYVPDLIFGASANSPLGTTEIVNRVIEAFFKDEEATVALTYYPIAPPIYTINPTINRPVPILAQNVDRQLWMPFFGRGPYSFTGLALKSASQGERIAPVFVTQEEGLDLHNEEDLFLARCYMRRRLEGGKGKPKN